MFTNLLWSFFFGILFLIVIYIIGEFLSVIFHGKLDNKFKKLSVGFITITSSYAIFNSGFHTIYFINAIIIACIIFYGFVSKSEKKHPKININELLKILLTYLLFAIPSIFYFFDISTLNEIALKPDYSYYAYLSGFLRDYGIENTYTNSFNLIDAVTPYHYFDVWSSAFVSDIFNINPRIVLFSIIYPILYTICYFGIRDLIEFLLETKNTFAKIIIPFLPFLFFFFSLIGFLYPNSIEVLAMDVFEIRLVEHPKLLIISVYLIFILMSLLKDELFSIVILSCSLIASYVSVAPPLFISISVYFTYLMIIKKLSIKNFLKLIIPLVVTMLLVFSFYHFFGSRESNSVINIDFQEKLVSLSYYRTTINIIVKMTIQVIIISLPFIILFALNFSRIKHLRKMFIFLIIMYISSLLVWAILWPMHDSVQLYSNIFYPTLNIVLFVSLMIIILTIKKRTISIGILTSLIVVTAFCRSIRNNDFSMPIENKVSLNSKISISKPRFVYLKESEDYKNTYFEKQERVFLGGLYSLINSYDPIVLTCISNHKIPISNEAERIFVNRSPFLLFVNELKKDNQFSTYDRAQIEFIKAHDINYILSNKSRKLPEHLQKICFDDAIGVIDNYSLYQLR